MTSYNPVEIAVGLARIAVFRDASEPEEVRSAALNCSGLPPIAVAGFVAGLDRPNLLLALRLCELEEIVAQWSLWGDSQCRAITASNPSTEPKVLAHLAQDPHSPVRESVAMNDNTPRDALERLADDDSYSVGECAALTLKRRRFARSDREPGGLADLSALYGAVPETHAIDCIEQRDREQLNEDYDSYLTSEARRLGELESELMPPPDDLDEAVDAAEPIHNDPLTERQAPRLIEHQLGATEIAGDED